MAAGSRKRARSGIIAMVLGISMLGQLPANSQELMPQALRGLTVPAGFGLNTFAETPGLTPSSLTFGPDGRLYAAALIGLSQGVILAYEDLGGVGGPPQIVAEGFNQILGITFGPDGTLYASDNADNTGRIQALRDANGDGAYEQRRVVLRNIPNGRHQTNGMAFGPDGKLYVANGNATDDGVECGPEPASPMECPAEEKKPWTGAILRVNPAWENVNLQTDITVDADQTAAADGRDDEAVLASTGYRNIYDVDFRPSDPSMIYTPMNGSDNPASNEPLYRLDVSNTRVVGHDAQGNPVHGPDIEDAGWPSCLYSPHANTWPIPMIEGHSHPEKFEPDESTDPRVTDKFGPCRRDEVIKPIMFFSEGHNGTSGLAFERGPNFPERYEGDLFVAEWGSIWNVNGINIDPAGHGTVTGHKITHVEIDPDTGLPTAKRAFLTGALPMDVTFGPDGAMYVADMEGFIYRVAHVMETPDMATVEITAGQFVPQVVAIPENTSVLWVNLDSVPHNVRQVGRAFLVDPRAEPPACVRGVAGSCTEIDSEGNIAPGKSYKREFGNLQGVWTYTSDANATDAAMAGAVIVTPVER